MENADTLLIKVEQLHNAMRDYVANPNVRDSPPEKSRTAELYVKIRRELLESEIASLLPRSVKVHDTLVSFEQTMRGSSGGGFAIRKEYLEQEFAPLIAKLEGHYASVIDGTTADLLGYFGLEHIQGSWERALSHIKDEPEAAITAARTMLESLFKTALDVKKVEYSDNETFPSLYAKVEKVLVQSAPKHIQNQIAQISIHIKEIVTNVGSVRNKGSDAHGRGTKFQPTTREFAEFTVNLAGSLAILIVRIYEEGD